ncbi:DNA polymerase III subunit gamma/tau [Desulfobotulus mexicanus]|uniref:DNA polymerase III subunit gamma/tau n=1 Tax=Desulfobotulus mexicanus TaxID=2586642 RepID=A0A5Q4VFA9_9BACT|nr:DNA polymerase III subunit gamma/tau [Desulfobotulus mexicanus]TYT75067.1 DNA polymerase III subunit gamma/tau [Desulfobotulus mexicanus]
MSYLVLARKYRSQSFSEIIAQEHVTRTLQNAILAGRVAHAILFCGPRGTGKTSIARILAKTMNCSEGPAPSPCNQCRSCKEITSGNGVDVMEIDGASNNSVDQIRDLRESLGYMPAHSRYRIYIIDEVHMLSTAAFNALLKTLEEPPAHVLFFFATTEPHKIPLTILSRCQRHDLRRVATPALTAHLAMLCASESVSIEEEGLDMIAREADGSVRDALSLLDRVIAGLHGAPAAREDVAAILGLAARSQSFRMAEALFKGDTADTLSIIRDLHDSGVDLKKFHTDLSTHIRNLLVVKVEPAKCREILDLPETAVKALLDQASPLTGHYLSRLMDILMTEEGTMRHAAHPRLAMETLMLRCLRIQPALSIDRLVERLDALRNDMLQETEKTSTFLNPVLLSPAPANHSLPASGSGHNKPHDVLEEDKKNIKPEPGPAAHAMGTKPAAELPPAIPHAQKNTSAPAQKKISPPIATGTPVKNNAPPSTKNSTASMASSIPPAMDSDFMDMPEEAPWPDTLAEQPEHEPLAPPSRTMAPEQAWKLLVADIRKKNPSLGELFATKTTLKKVSDQSIHIEVQGSGFSAARLGNDKTRHLLESLTGKFFGRSLKPEITTLESDSSESLRNQSEKEHLRNDATTHPLVHDALEIFKGRVADITFL